MHPLKKQSKHYPNFKVLYFFFLTHQKLQKANIIEEVKAGVYSLSGLGQMHRVWGLHKRLSSQLF